MTNFQKEFPDFPAADFPALPVGFTDSSFYKDACPSIKNETLGLLIFIDYADVAKRQVGAHLPRFSVLKLDGEGILEDCETVLESNDWDAVVAFAEARR